MNQASSPASRSSRLRAFLPDAVFVSAALALAVFTRFHHLGEESLWLDEAITFERSRLPVPQLIEEAAAHYHNPTYFLIIHYWMRFGDDEFMLRAPSAFFGVLKVLLVYLLGRIAAGRVAGLAAALLASVYMRQVWYDQEARPYALLTMAAALAMCGVLWLVRDPERAAAAPWRAQGRPAIPAWLAFVTGAVVAVYSQATAVLFVTACSLVALIVLAARPAERRGFFVNWTVANLLVLAAFSPWLPTLFTQGEAIAERGFWAHDPTVDIVVRTVKAVLLAGDAEALGFGLVALALVGTWSLRKAPLIPAALWTFALGGPGLLLLVSLKESIFMLRQMLWSAVPFCVLAGVGMAALRPRWASLGVGIVVVTLLGMRLQDDYYHAHTKPRWRDALGYLAKLDPKTSAILATGGREGRLIRYYTERNTNPIPKFAVELRQLTTPRVKRALVGKKYAYTIHARNVPLVAQIHVKLQRRGRYVGKREYGYPLQIEKYRLDP